MFGISPYLPQSVAGRYCIKQAGKLVWRWATTVSRLKQHK